MSHAGFGKPKFKVGDKVKIVLSGMGCHPKDLGRITTIEKVELSPYNNSFTYEIDTAGFFYKSYSVRDGSFELAEEGKNNILTASIGQIKVFVNIDKASSIIEGKNLEVIKLHNDCILFAYHLGDGKIDLDLTDVGKFLEESNPDIMKSDELDAMEDMIIAILESKIKKDFDIKWPVVFGDLNIHIGGQVTKGSDLIGRFDITNNDEQEPSVIFITNPTFREDFGLLVKTLDDLAKAGARLEELYKLNLWKARQ